MQLRIIKLQAIENYFLNNIHDFFTLNSRLFARVNHRKWFKEPGFVFSTPSSNFPKKMF